MKGSNSVGSNYFFHTLYQIVALLTPLVTAPYVARVLLPEGVGRYSYYSTLVQYFVFTGNLGFSTYGQIQIAKDRDNKDKVSKIFWEIFLLRFIIFILCSLVYLFFCLVSENKTIMLILFGLMIAGALDISWLYFGIDDFKSISLRNIFVKALSIAGIFLFVKSSDDVPVYTAILTLSTLAGSLIVWRKIGSLVGKPKLKEYEYKKHMKPAIAFFLPNIATMIYTMADKTMIGLITHSDYQNGLYEQAHKIEQILVQFLLSIGVVYRSEMARLFAVKDYEKAENNIRRAMQLLLLISFPVCTGLISISRELIGWFLGDKYLECIALLRVFSVLLVVISISNCMSNMYLIVTEKQDKFRRGTYSGAVVNIACNVFLIPKYGALGAAVSSVIAETVILCVFYYYSKQLFKWNDYLSEILKYIILCCFMFFLIQLEASVLEPYRFVSLVAEVLSGIVIYFLGLFVIRDDAFLLYWQLLKRKLSLMLKK